MKSNFMEEAYLYTVAQLLPKGVNKDEVLIELRSHIADSIHDLQSQGFSEKEATLETFRRLGSPREIANQFAGIKQITRFQLATRLLLFNFILFFIGTALVLTQAYLSSPMQDHFWNVVIENKYHILAVYSLIWLLCGYMIGKLYGFSLRKWFGNVIHIPLSLNYVFMLAILFGFVPTEWFGGLLHTKFVLICVLFTFLLSVFLHVGYFFGTRSNSQANKM